MICESCGCSDDDPCIDDEGQPCGWVAPGLCSACVSASAEEAPDPPGFDFDQEKGLWLPT